MPGSKITSKTKNYYANYCCSHCANPVINHIIIKYSQQNYSGAVFGATDEEIAAQLSSEFNKIDSSLKQYLADPTATDFPAEDVYGLKSSCPICGNTEAWQDPELLWKMEVSEPVLLKESLTISYAWAQEILRKKKAASEEIRNDPSAFQHTLLRCRQLEEDILSCLSKKDTCSEAQEVAALSTKIDQMENDLKGSSIFKRVTGNNKEELKKCQEALVSAQDRYQTVCKQFDIEAAKMQKEKAELSFSEKTYTDQMIMYENENCMAFSLNPVDGETDLSQIFSLDDLPQVKEASVSPYEKERRGLVQTLVDNSNTVFEVIQKLKGE